MFLIFLNLKKIVPAYRWKKLFIETFDKFILDPSYYNNVFPTQWKELFILRSNWFSGHCHVQSLHRKTVTTQQKEFSRIICLKISNCGRSLLASVNHDSKLVHLWSLINKKSLHVVFCESIVGCVDFGSERSRNLLAIGLFNNKVCTYKIKVEPKTKLNHNIYQLRFYSHCIL